MRRLYLRIYLWFLGIGVAALVAGGVAAWVAAGRTSAREVLVGSVVGLTRLRPESSTYRRDVERLAAELDADLTVFDPDGSPRWTFGPPLPAGPPGPFREHGVAGVRVSLADGRMFALRSHDTRARWLGFWAAVLGVFALGTWPLARRLTRRLELVERTAARWGRGELSARAPVSGRDEVASLARAFNAAADRIEGLVGAQRRVLASASHELRSPLARLRLALEMVSDERPHPLLDGAIRDVEILDETVEELLTAGRLQAMDALPDPEDVDLDALVAEEAGRVGAAVAGSAGGVRGNPALLRSLARNLLENARRHGAPPIEVTLSVAGFAVSDAGPGVPDAHKDRIFEPFWRPPGHSEGRDGGVGLGLHLCRRIAELHGGGVSCEDRPGGGTVFRVTLPRV